MRCFIIGNGKSLTVEQLDLIQGKPSIACNRINKVYPFTKWRPTIYVHPEAYDFSIPFIQENIALGIECHLGEYYAEHPIGVLGIPDAPNIRWIKECHHWTCNFDTPDIPDEWHLPQLCSFGGAVNMAMQVAVKKGYDELILLGCDLEYRDNKPSHFTEDYEHGQEQPAFLAGRNALFGHIHALNWIRRKKKNVRVLNATPGGLLEIWERVDLEDVA